MEDNIKLSLQLSLSTQQLSAAVHELHNFKYKHWFHDKIHKL